jgi:hypothetical protein
MTNINRRLGEYNRNITGPADMIVRKEFGQKVDPKVFEDPSIYQALQDALNLESVMVYSLSGIFRPDASSIDMTVKPSFSDFGFAKNLYVNLEPLRKHSRISAVAAALAQLQITSGREPYRLGFNLNETQSQSSSLIFYGATPDLLPEDLSAATNGFLRSNPGEAWKVQTIFSNSSDGLTRIVNLPIKLGSNFTPQNGEVTPTITNLRTKNIAAAAGLEWKSIKTPISVGDLGNLRAGYIIAVELLSAAKQRQI